MAKIWEKAVLILAGNLNSGLSYLITTVICTYLVKTQVNESLPAFGAEVPEA